MSILNRETGELVEPLTAMEQSALARAEVSIEQGADQVASALGQIRDQRLYRADYPTFEAYCRERWGMTHRHVNRQIVAAEVAEALGPIGPANIPEGQARELAPLRNDPEKLRETYWQAHEATDGKVTAAALNEAVRTTTGLDGRERTSVTSGRSLRPQPRPAAEKTLNLVALYATKAARAASDLTADQIRRTRPEADQWTADLRNSIEVLEHLVDSLDPEENK